MQLAQLVLLNEGFETNSKSGFESRQLIHAPQRIVSGVKLTSHPFPCPLLVSLECPFPLGIPPILITSLRISRPRRHYFASACSGALYSHSMSQCQCAVLRQRLGNCLLEAVGANLHFVVVSLQFPTQLFKFLFQSHRLAEFCPAGISFFLESVSAFLVLLIFSFEASHVG